MQHVKLVELARENATRLMEIMDHIDDGQLRCELNGQDVTEAHLAGFVKNLANLETIINTYGPRGGKVSAMETATAGGVLFWGIPASTIIGIIVTLMIALCIAMNFGSLIR